MQLTQKNGFSLIEILVALVIVGIVSAIAYPNYLSYVTRAKRSEGQTTLINLLLLQERYFTDNNSYTTTLGTGGLGQNVDAAGMVTTNEGAYKIQASVCSATESINNCVLLTATPQGSQVSDGALTLNSRNQKSGTW